MDAAKKKSGPTLGGFKTLQGWDLQKLEKYAQKMPSLFYLSGVHTDYQLRMTNNEFILGQEYNGVEIR